MIYHDYIINKILVLLKNYTAIKDVGNLSKTKKTEVIKCRILIDIKNLFEHEEEEKYYKPVIVSNLE